MTTDGILIEQIKKEFGDLSYDRQGNLNRKYLSEVVFGNQKKLSVLNSLVHPRVGVDYTQWVKTHQALPYVLKEAALLFESGSYQQLDCVVVVYAPEDLRVQRVLKRDNRTEQQIRDIIKTQISEEEKKSRANAIIINDEQQLVIPQVLALHHRFRSMIA